MKIVIDIDEYDKEWIHNAYDIPNEIKSKIVDAIDNATPLPEHHGRLGDLDALEKEMINGIKAGNYEEGYERYQNINDMDDCVECVRYADTIIEGSESE